MTRCDILLRPNLEPFVKKISHLVNLDFGSHVIYLTQYLVCYSLSYAHTFADHPPEVCNTAHQKVWVCERPPPLGAVHLIQLDPPIGIHVSPRVTCPRTTLLMSFSDGVRLGLSYRVGRLVLLFGYDL